MKRALWLAPLLLLLVFAVVAAVRLIAGPGQEAPRFSASGTLRPAPSGAYNTLTDSDGYRFGGNGPEVVNLFASWCTPCRAEHPLLTELASDPAVRLTGVLYKDTDENGRAFLNELGDPFGVIVRDADGLLGLDFGITGVPETFLIDGEGRIVKHYRGMLTPADVREIRAFFAEPR